MIRWLNTCILIFQAEQSPKTPKKTVAFEVDQLQKLTEDEITLKMKDEEEKQEDIISEGKFKIDKNVEMENQETSSTLTGKLKKHITKKVKLHYLKMILFIFSL